MPRQKQTTTMIAAVLRRQEADLAKSRQDHAQDVRCMSERIGRLEAVRDAAVAAVRCADTCEGPHPVSQMEIITTWDHLRAAISAFKEVPHA